MIKIQIKLKEVLRIVNKTIKKHFGKIYQKEILIKPYKSMVLLKQLQLHSSNLQQAKVKRGKESAKGIL